VARDAKPTRPVSKREQQHLLDQQPGPQTIEIRRAQVAIRAQCDDRTYTLEIASADEMDGLQTFKDGVA
jgi:hypothetical protein